MSEGTEEPERCGHTHLDVWYAPSGQRVVGTDLVDERVLAIECDSCDTRWPWPKTWVWTSWDRTTMWCSEGMA